MSDDFDEMSEEELKLWGFQVSFSIPIAGSGGRRTTNDCHRPYGGDRRPGVTRYISSATAYELAIKESQGKLRLPRTPAEFVNEIIADGAIEIGISVPHALRAANLPQHHHDPFDRLLIAQAQLEGLQLVTADPRILAYDVPALDARK